MVTIEESVRDAQTVRITPQALQTIVSEVNWLRLGAHGRKAGFMAENQPIMCDFQVVKADKNPSRFYISLLLEMEGDDKTKGILFFTLATLTEFEFRPSAEPTALPENEAERWGLFKIALDAAIGFARAYLVNYLAPTIYQGYLLPLLDTDALIRHKYVRPKLPAVPSASPSEKPTPRAKKGEK